jgi:hypothetical protein
MKKTVLWAICLFALAACRKDKMHLSTDKDLLDDASITSTICMESPGNPSNPYDSLGINHNKIMDSVLTYVMRTGDTSCHGKRHQVILYFRQHYHMDISGKLEKTHQLIRHNHPNNFNGPIAAKAFSSLGISYIDGIRNILGTATEHSSYPTFKKLIMDLEEKIIGDDKLSRKEQTGLLVMSSITRHSFWYWYNSYNEAPERKLQAKGFLKSIIKAIASAQWDMFGAIYSIIEFESKEQVLADAAWPGQLKIGYEFI